VGVHGESKPEVIRIDPVKPAVTNRPTAQLLDRQVRVDVPHLGKGAEHEAISARLATNGSISLSDVSRIHGDIIFPGCDI
jgi:hypothetical protein